MIRPADFPDIGPLTEMAFEFFSVGNLEGTGLACDQVSVMQFLFNLIDSKNDILLVAEHEGELIGVIGGAITPWMFNENQLIMTEQVWFVPERFREKHPMAALRLLKELRKVGRKAGVETLILSSNERPESAKVRSFYEKIGFSMKDVNYIGRI